MRNFLLLTMVLLPVLCQAQELPPWDLRALADANLKGFDKLPDMDKDGYGNLAWGVSYGMMALNVLYEATGDIAYLQRQADLIGQILDKTDTKLAEKYGAETYQDYQRKRVLNAWGTGGYTAGEHTVWAVHAGMVLYPMAEFVRLVRAGRPQTAALGARAEAYLPRIEAIIKEFDSEWRDGPTAGMGYYLFPNGENLPNNQMNAPGRALFVLYDLTKRPEYRDKAWKLAAFFKSKLTHVTAGDYYLWSYWNKPPESPPGTGEDTSHAAINAHFLYLAWQHKAGVDDQDIARLSRTFTVALNLGPGLIAAGLGNRTHNPTYAAQAGRWGHLARFDPQVERMLYEYEQAHPKAFSWTTGALGYAYLLRARKLRAEDLTG